ncbi:hypothetical protein B0H14DRAFT_2593081 [Mycena olivaceomarginata]|nr:hypothetical protein B0H14DRAFT_2593081 [Mycena olivaceomarginata]
MTRVMQDDEDGLPSSNQSLLAAVRKLRRIVRAVRSSPQRRTAWKDEVKMSYKDREARKLTGYMLILDVKTRWSSTHQMLRACTYFLWLEAFRTATTQMSATKSPMISTTHAVFRGLQEEWRKLFGTLLDNVAPQLKQGIISAHTKLSDYYTKFDESPLYTWAGLLDPRISYEGMKRDYSSDADLAAYLEPFRPDTRQASYRGTAQTSSAPTDEDQDSNHDNYGRDLDLDLGDLALEDEEFPAGIEPSDFVAMATEALMAMEELDL